MMRIKQWFISFTMFLAISVLITGCGSVKIVANHDPAIEKGVTDLQKKVEPILTNLKNNKSNPAASYDAKNYEKIQEDINILRTRASAWEKNTKTVNMIDELAAAILEHPTHPPKRDIIESTDNSQSDTPPPAPFSIQQRNMMKDPLGDEDVQMLRTLVESHFRSILRFELLKQRS